MRLDHNEPVLNRSRPGDPHDTTTPIAMAGTLRRLVLGKVLSPGSRELLAGWLIDCKTGDNRLRGGLPKDWRIGNKTGNNGKDASGDIAMAWPLPLLLSSTTAALACLVIHVADGDTVTGRCSTPHGVQNLRIRLAEIDAPETGQPFGDRSKQSLLGLCAQRVATVVPKNLDQYGRNVATVNCSGKDVGTYQVTAGMAWVFDRYATDHSLYQLQEAAKQSHTGLWADSKPVPPWEWRKLHKRAFKKDAIGAQPVLE